MRARRELLSLVGVAAGFGLIVWAHLSGGGAIGTFVQLPAMLVVVGGTAAALLVSFPASALWRAAVGVVDVVSREPPSLEELVPTFTDFAHKVKRRGLAAIEDDIAQTRDTFLIRALNITITGLAPDLVRQALEIDARVSAEQDEEEAQVLESAAGYAPTLGIVGAVLGLMKVMQQIGSPADVGAGIAAAFVATVYGIGLSNLVFLPLAMRLRARARIEALRRELTIDGVIALRDGMHPGLVEERLAGYLQETPTDTEAA